MTAYGPQEHETTPWLKDMRSDRNFILFDKAYTSYVATVSALTYALTAKNQYNDISYDDSPSIVEVVRASGYETYWLSNQSKISPWSKSFPKIGTIGAYAVCRAAAAGRR